MSSASDPPSNSANQSQSIPPDTKTKENGYTPGDDSSTQWRNAFALMSGKMSEQGKTEYRKFNDLKYEQSDIERCEKQRDWLMQYSPVVRFMLDNIAALGGPLDKNNIVCRRCPTAPNGQRTGGGFAKEFGVLLCANELRLQNKSWLEDTLAHELVHAYDHLRFKVDEENLRHTACTEIRASSLSGECRFAREFFGRLQFKVSMQHQECVRRRATLSVRARPWCKSDEQAAKVVNEVWDSCFSDTRPFDEVYK